MAVKLALFVGNDAHGPPRIVMSWGLGVDSTFILLRWLTEPSSRSFDLDELVVLTARVGDGGARQPATPKRSSRRCSPSTESAHPGRPQPAQRDQRRRRRGDSGRLPITGTPARRGRLQAVDRIAFRGNRSPTRRGQECSLHSKAAVLTPVIERITAGQPYLHVLGFEAGEISRSRKDALYNTATRRGWCPMQDWGVDRESPSSTSQP